MEALKLAGVVKRFGDFTAVDDLDLTFGREIAYPLEPRTNQGGPTITFVFEDPFRRANPIRAAV